MTTGQQIAKLRSSIGVSQRQLASILGTTTRRIKAVETDSQPQPKLEKRVQRMLFVPFLGYAVKCYSDFPVEDKGFDLENMQYQILRILEKV